MFRLIVSWYNEVQQNNSNMYSLERIDDMHRFIQLFFNFKWKVRTMKSILMCWLDMYPEDFLKLDGKNYDFSLIEDLIDFGRKRRFHDLKQNGRKVKDRLKRIVSNGGLSGLSIFTCQIFCKL